MLAGRPPRPAGSASDLLVLGQAQSAAQGVLRVPDDPVQGGDVATVGGSPGLGEAEPDPLPLERYSAVLRELLDSASQGR